MGKILLTLIIIIMFFGATSFAQEYPVYTISEKRMPDVSPKYPGPGTFQEYIHGYVKNIRLKVSQRINIKFIVEKDGTLSNVVFPEGTEEKMIKKLLKAFKKCKKWSPGMLDGKTVRVGYTLPLRVRITN